MEPKKLPFSDSLKNSNVNCRICLNYQKHGTKSPKPKVAESIFLTDLGNFCLNLRASNDQLKNKFELYLSILKKQGERRQALGRLISEFEDRFRKWSQNSNILRYIDQLPLRLKDGRDIRQRLKTKLEKGYKKLCSLLEPEAISSVSKSENDN